MQLSLTNLICVLFDPAIPTSSFKVADKEGWFRFPGSGESLLLGRKASSELAGILTAEELCPRNGTLPLLEYPYPSAALALCMPLAC
jgi:hypothetical protein